MGERPTPAPGVFVGIDIAKGNHYACAVSASGEALFARAVPNDESAIRRMIDDAGDHGRPALVVDMTSSAAVLALTVAAEMTIPVAYVTGLAMRRAADLYAGAAKTDPKDAQVLADYAWRNADRLSWTTVTDELLARLRILNGRDTDLASDATRTVNRLRDALLAVSPALERAVGERLMSTPGLRAALVKYPTPAALRTAGKARVRSLISKRSKRAANTLTDQIWAALSSQTVTVPAEATWGETIGDLAADLDRIIDRRQRLEADIEQAFLEHPLGKVLNSMCGFGPRTGARTLAEIGDPHRFANPGRLAAYAGLAPVDRQSGRSHRTGRSRGGNHRLKNAMFIAAFVATRHDPDARAYYLRKRAQGKDHNAAVICVARRRCNIILAMLKTQTPYQPRQPEKLPEAA
ncbi:IS110 family transposase [Candidatus Spongiisocius sp.]|uniref:IS110 family transposase n=1 Tax=Candidatus Spongiisocius sp. TaxID=3101273 RepID=UPI003B5AADF7